MYFPSRGGVRGGADQFNWDDIKSDKFRENYLGHSLKAPVGRWQKGKDLTWYNNKDKSDSASSKKAFAALKAAEEEAMLAALGHKPVKRETSQLSKEELAEAFKRGQSERSTLDIERVEGMGFSSARAALSNDKLHFQSVSVESRKASDQIKSATEEQDARDAAEPQPRHNQQTETTESSHDNHRIKKSKKRTKENKKKKKSSPHPSESSSAEDSEEERRGKKGRPDVKNDMSVMVQSSRRRRRRSRDDSPEAKKRIPSRHSDSENGSDTGKSNNRSGREDRSRSRKPVPSTDTEFHSSKLSRKKRKSERDGSHKVEKRRRMRHDSDSDEMLEQDQKRKKHKRK